MIPCEDVYRQGSQQLRKLVWFVKKPTLCRHLNLILAASEHSAKGDIRVNDDVLTGGQKLKFIPFLEDGAVVHRQVKASKDRQHCESTTTVSGKSNVQESHNIVLLPVLRSNDGSHGDLMRPAQNSFGDLETELVCI